MNSTTYPDGLGEQDVPAFRFSRMESLLRGRPVRRLAVDGVSAVFVNDPVLVRRILVNDNKKYGKGELFRKARNLSRVGLLTEDEAMHRHYRRLANPYLRSSKVEEYSAAMHDIAHGVVASWPAGTAVDVQEEMCRISCAVAVGTLLSGLPPKTTEVLSERLSVLAWEMVKKPLYGKALSRAERQVTSRRLARARKDFRELLATHIAHLVGSPGSPVGYLSALLSDSDGTGNRVLSADEVCEEAVMMLTASTVTTASVMSWALHAVAEDPLVEERLLKELARERGESGGDGPGVPRYSLRFLMEVLRLYPPVWISCRKTLTGVTLGDHAVPAGTNVVFSSYLLHRDPGRYPEPHRFDPDRWLSTRPGKDDASYIPFGMGAAGCIGELFAWEELEVILGAVLREWSLRTEPGFQIRKAPETTLHPRRLLMVPQPR